MTLAIVVGILVATVVACIIVGYRFLKNWEVELND
jgi:hypothetical protein